VSERGGDALLRRIDTMSTPLPDPERLAGDAELRRLLEGAIDALPDEFRTVFMLRAVEGMSVAETAQALAIRPETVKTRFHRARRRLQDALGARFEALMPTAFDFGGERCDRIVAAVLARLQPALEAARQEPARRPPLPSRGRPGGADPG
jgi:RNA polymerase sigma-70 factor (ECF subfamily)